MFDKSHSKTARVGLLAGVAAALVFVATVLAGLARGGRGNTDLRLSYFAPFNRVIGWLNAPPPVSRRCWSWDARASRAVPKAWSMR